MILFIEQDSFDKRFAMQLHDRMNDRMNDHMTTCMTCTSDYQLWPCSTRECTRQTIKKHNITYRRIAPERLHRLRRLHRLWASIESLSDIAVQLFSFIAFEVLRASFRYRLGID